MAEPEVKSIEAPKPVTKAKIVLDEDEYVDRLDNIIQRDYFPELPRLRAQHDYLDALQKNDVAKIRQLQMKYSSRRSEQVNYKKTPMLGKGANSPKEFETPLQGVRQRPNTGHAWESTPSTSFSDQQSEASEGKPKDTDPDSKDARHTVTSFLTKYTSEDNESYAELIDLEEQRREAKYPWMKQSELDHARKFGPEAIKGPENEKALDTWTSYTSKNAVLWHPEAAPLTHEEADKRHKRGSAKLIIRENTRLEADPFKAPSTSTPNTPSVVGGQAAADPLRRGPNQGYVVTPSPMPGVNESPMMTWGEIEGTPFLLDAADVPHDTVPGPEYMDCRRE